MIDWRYRRLLRTVVVLNAGKGEEQDILGDAAFSRLNEGGITLYTDWKPYR